MEVSMNQEPETIEAGPLRLPPLPAEVQASRNRIFSRTHSWPFKLGEREFEARIKPKWEGGMVSLAVHGVWGDSRFELFLRAASVEILSTLLAVPMTPASWSALPPIMRLAVWEAGLDKALAALSKKSGESVSVTGVDEFPERALEPHADWLCVEWKDKASGMVLDSALRFPGGHDDFRRAAQFLAGMPDQPRPAPDDWPVEAAIELATERIGLEVLKSAGRGDIIVLTGEVAAGGRAAMRIGNRRLLPVALADGKATVLEEKMPEEKKAADPSARKGAVAADAIEVNLTLELDSRLWQVKDLAQIQPGYVFDTGKTLASPVTLKVNGREWGKGEMVDLGGKVGVRLLSLA